MSKCIGVYEMFREYGGPEEGGWYYDMGYLVHVESLPNGVTPKYVRALCQDLADSYQDPNARPIHSVMYDGGIFEAFTFNGEPPGVIPEELPRWE